MPGEWNDDEFGGSRTDPPVSRLVVRGVVIIIAAVVSAFWILLMHAPVGH